MAAPSPFLRLPLEIRLEIYEHLLVLPTGDTGDHLRNIMACAPDYHVYEQALPGQTGATDAAAAAAAVHQPRQRLHFRNSQTLAVRDRRALYKIRTDRFRARCMDATYVCVNRPAGLAPAVLRANRQTYREAAAVLYGGYAFDFDTNIEACVPFLTDMTPFARGCLREVSIVKRSLPYDKDFDRCEWAAMCAYVAENLRLSALSLGVVAGKPISGWGKVQAYEEDEFRTVARMPEMGWVNDLAGIKGLSRLEVKACVEHCPPPMSSIMEFFVAFSASVETTFAQYLSGRMIEQAA